MNTGYRIRHIRTFKGVTQKELGIAIGFNEENADIRIAQYESGSRRPKDNTISAIASVLGVAPKALTVPQIESLDDFIHILFAFEDFYGIAPKTICACCDSILEHLSNTGNSNEPLFDFLFEWNDVAMKFVYGVITKSEYDLWRYNYSFSQS